MHQNETQDIRGTGRFYFEIRPISVLTLSGGLLMQ